MDEGRPRHGLRRRGGRDHDDARRQRRGQADDAPRGLRDGEDRGRGPLRRPPHRRPGDRGHRAPRHRPRARGPRHLHAAHGRGKSEIGRLRAPGEGDARRRPAARLRVLPGARRAARPDRGEPLGRRAADARRGARPHAAAAPPAPRRALARARAARRARDLPHRARDQSRGAGGRPAGGAERRDGARPRRPRIPPRDRARRHVGPGRRPQEGRRHPALVPRVLRVDIFVQQVVSGLSTGGIYGSLALALVMIYRATDVVNYAQGEMAMFSTYLAWTMINAGLPYWVAFFATLTVAFVGGLLIERVVIRPVERAPLLTIVIVCIGLLVILNSVAGWIYSYIQKPFPSPFPQTPLRLGALIVGAHDVGAIGVTLVVLAFLYVFFRYTPLGLAMRAAAQNPVSSRLVGIRVGWMLALGWGLAALVGAVGGMMVAPIVFLDPNMMAGILIYAFASATLGGFTSPGGAVLGGFIVGVVENLVGTYVK